MSLLLDLVKEEFNEKRASIPNFSAGDTVNIHVKIREGNKERIQQFQGVVIQRRNVNSNGETFTVRKCLTRSVWKEFSLYCRQTSRRSSW